MARQEYPRCFVTGATGHIGSFLVRLLLEQGHSVAILVRGSSNPWRVKELLPQLHRIEGDLSNSPAWSEQLRAFSPDIVFHLGWEGATGARDSSTQLTRNVIDTLQLLDASHNAGSRVFVGAGSQAEYGACASRVVEERPANPGSPYGLAKYCLSQLTGEYCSLNSMRGLWLRVFSVYGPMDDPRHMLPSLIDKLLQAQSVPLTGGDQIWDYLYVEDAVRAMYAAAITPTASGIYNIASGNPIRLRTLIEKVRDRINPDQSLGFGEIPYIAGQVMHLEGDVERLKAHTDWKPRVDLEKGIDLTIDWHRSVMHHDLIASPPQVT